MAHQITGEPDDQEQLDRLDHLESHHAQVEPALGAIDLGPHMRHQHQHQHQHRHQQQARPLALDAAQFGATDQNGQGHTQAQKNQVLVHEMERIQAQPLSDADRTGHHHHHTQSGQDQHGREQHPIEASFDLVEAESLFEAFADHQRTFNVARPISTSTKLMIQKRTITRGSGQPLSSK